MDARDRLRRYVEQRRELGETEFVLDGLPVEDVLRLLGATGTSRATTSNSASRIAEPSQRAGADAPRSQPDKGRVTAERGTESATRGDADVPAVPTVPAVEAPPVPDVRFDAAASTDWRKALSGVDSEASAPPASLPSMPELSAATPSASSPFASMPTAPSTSAPLSAGSVPPWLAALGIPIGLTVGETSDARSTGSLVSASTLDEVAAAIGTCQACALFSSATHPVPGEGNPDADFVCVGEAPGANEDESGRPFVGAAGQLLTKILAAIQMPREDAFICNVLKHRPPGNRNPLPDEVRACRPYLTRQLELLRPRVILALGTFAAQTLLDTSLSIGKLRGQVHRYHGVPLIVTYHPAALLRNEAWKRPTWEDVKLARRILDASRAANPSA